MGERSADRAAAARRGMADVPERSREQGDRGAGVRRAEHVDLPRERADAQEAVHFDPIEPRDTVDIDEQRGARQAHVQQRDEALPAREDLRVAVPECGKGLL